MAAAMDAAVESLVALATDPSGDPVITDARTHGLGRADLTRASPAAPSWCACPPSPIPPARSASSASPGPSA